MCISRKTFTIGILVTVFIACMIFRADSASAITGDKDQLTLLSYNHYPGFIELSYVNDYNSVTCECSDDSVVDSIETDGWSVIIYPGKAGEATITVKDGVSEPFVCTVNVIAPEVSFRHDEILFDKFESFDEFDADSTFVDPDDDLKDAILNYPETDHGDNIDLRDWNFAKLSSSNSSVLLVHNPNNASSSWFEICNAGTAILTGTTKSGATAQCKVTVTQNYVNQRKAAWQRAYDKEVYAEMKKLIKGYPDWYYEREYYCPVGYEDSPIKTKLVIKGKTYKKGKYVLYDYGDYQKDKEYVIRIPQVKIGTKIKWVLWYKDKKVYRTFKYKRETPEFRLKPNYKKNKAKITVSHYLKGDKLIIKVGKKKYTWKVNKDCRKPFDPKTKWNPIRKNLKYTFKVPGYNKKTKIKVYMKNKYNQVFCKEVL